MDFSQDPFTLPVTWVVSPDDLIPAGAQRPAGRGPGGELGAGGLPTQQSPPGQGGRRPPRAGQGQGRAGRHLQQDPAGGGGGGAGVRCSRPGNHDVKQYLQSVSAICLIIYI